MSILMETLIRRAVYPLWAMRDHPGLNSYFREYQRTQFWPKNKILELQWQRLRRTVRLAFDHCPFYAEQFGKVGFHPNDFRSLDDFRRLPILTKDDIRNNQAALLARGVPSASYEDNYTGGSTGSPISFKVSKRRWASRKAMTLRHDLWSGWKLGEWIGVLWGHPEEQAGTSFRDRLRNHLLYREVTLNTFDVRQVNFDSFVRALHEKDVRFLLSYSRSLLMFAHYVASCNVKLPVLKAAVTTAECLSPDERAFIEQTLHCRTFDRYGCREFSVIASECEAHDGLHVAAEALFVEFMVEGRAVEPGAVGEVLVTDLIEEAMPFIRYKIGDLGTTMEGPCACGRGLPRMQMLAGRVTDFIHTPDGRWLSGVAINTYLISQIPAIRQAQILQMNCSHLTFRLVPNGPQKGAAEAFLTQQVPKMFGARMTHIVEWAESIQPEASGKVRVTISQCGLKHGFDDGMAPRVTPAAE
jgi:phenylacetate-CoA ligase